MAISAEDKKNALAPYVYSFGGKQAPPPLDKYLLGGKGKGLAEMSSIGLPVPPGFIITTTACNEYRKANRRWPDGLKKNIESAMKELENLTGAEFGSETNPLLVSVRSGAAFSMPGMMDTILNLGLNDRSVVGFANISKNERLAYDNYRRFIMMYSDVVEGISKKHFEQAFEVLKLQEGVKEDNELSCDGLKEACKLFRAIYENHGGKPFPQNAEEQLFASISAVFDSWDGERATLYRQINHISGDLGTAVNVETMVFGNKNGRSATGVCFTRDPATGSDRFYGEYLLNAQGEEVVAGTRTPHPINNYQKEITGSSLPSLEEEIPEAYCQLHKIVKQLEEHYGDMQDIEFTIDDGKLYILQTRTGKRTGFAAVRIASEMLKEGLIDEKTALKRVNPDQLMQLLAPIFDSQAKKGAHAFLVAKGLNAGPGAASGIAAFSSSKAVEMQQKGLRCILIREEANPNDFAGMVAAEGILTVRGGSTSHAAVVARGMGKPCVVGCGSLVFNEKTGTLSSETRVIKEGDPVSIDGSTGEVFFCNLPTSPSEIVQVLLTGTIKAADSPIYGHYKTIMDLTDKYSLLRVRANADSPIDSAAARAFGAEGIGLCRTEHMFMNSKRLNDVRCMFFSMQPEEQKRAIASLLPYQKQDFIDIFRTMDGYPVTIRLLDPPLHEFMPHSQEEIAVLAELMNVPEQKLLALRSYLEEHNPMLGYRGCRLGVTMPELTAMQTRAILEAAITVGEEGVAVFPEIMLPLIATEHELNHQKAVIDKTAKEVFEEQKVSVHYTVGTMIELPRACLIADRIARTAEFFSFGTNDLTQTTYGISRDDSSKFVPIYVKGVPHPEKHEITMHLFQEDPFQVLDREGVGNLMRLAVQSGRKVRPHLKCGICGEHGGEPASIEFCHRLGLDYVSCSPYRVPVARLAAAQANV